MEHGDAAGHGDSAEHGDAAGHGDVMEHGDAAGHGDVMEHGDAAGHGDSAAHGDSAGHGDGHAAGSSDAVEHVHGQDGHAAAPMQAEEAEDEGRRLSGGGGSYDSFGECLENNCEQDVAHHCGLTPDVFTLIGHAGVALMIFESGMHFDFEKARVVGPKACVVAVVGTIFPLIAGSILMVLFGRPFMPHGISAGTALAPTSVGIALRLLGEAGVLQEDFGQAIITAAFVDDILSLVLFNVLFSLGGEFDVFKTVIAPIIGIAFMLGAMVAAVKFWPRVIDEMLLPQAPDNRTGLRGWRKIRLEKDELLFLLQIIMLVVYSLITHLLGTHLWGCFIAGMSFACLSPPHHAHHVWVKQTKRMTTWMIRIFFACTVAFSIPVMKLLSFSAFWKGSIMGVIACIATKVCCAPFMGDARWVIGWAMVGRAEFAYLIAQMALSGNMLDEESFSIVIWALLYATVFAPFVFRALLNKYIRDTGLGKSGDGHALSGEEDLAEEAGHASAGFDKGEKAKLDFSNNPAGEERLKDLNEIDLEDTLHKTEKGRRRKSGEQYEENDDYTAPVPVGMGSARGKAAAPRAGHSGSNGFLCCLFFKKIIVQ